MTSIEAAVGAAEVRKATIFGDSEDAGLVVTAQGEFRQRAIYSGFDIDMDELADVSHRAGDFFCRMTPSIGLRALFIACWTDAFLIGLLAGQQTSSPTTNPGEETDDFAGEGGSW